MKPLIFLGSNHNLQQMVDICQLTGFDVIGVLDSDYYGNREHICGVPVIGSENTFEFSEDYVYFNAVNLNPSPAPHTEHNYKKHSKISNLINDHSLKCINLLHPTAIIPGTADLGSNVMVGAYAVIGNNTTIGDFCQIREQSYVAHGARLYNNVVVQVKSYVGANIEVMENCYIAVNATVVSRSGTGGVLPANTFVKTAKRYIV